MATYYSYDDIHKIDAWQDNNITLMLTQGEGLNGETGNNTYVKRPTFQLKDERGIISIPTTGARLELAFTRKDGTTGSLGSNEISASDGENGIVSFTVKPTLTSVAGKVKGEIRLITSNAVIKFYGVNFYVKKGVSDVDAVNSEEFDDLIKALQEVVGITPEGTAILDTLDENGELPTNGTNPVASGVLKTFLGNHYEKYKTISLNDLNNRDTHLDPQTIYKVHGHGLVVVVNDFDGLNKEETQYYFAEDGIMRYRYRKKVNGEWENWNNRFSVMINEENLSQKLDNNLNPYLSPQNKLDKYFVKTCIDKSKVKLNKETKILGFGDSIMSKGYGGSWMDKIQERIDCPDPINMAVGGAQFVIGNTSQLLSTQLTNFFAMVDNQQIDASTINLIIIAAGTNDAYNGTPIDSFQSAVNDFFDDLQNGFETRDLDLPPVLVITPIRRGKESEINAIDNNIELKIVKYSAVLNNSALEHYFSVLNGFDIPVLVDDMDIDGVSTDKVKILSFMYKTKDSGDPYDDILHVHPNPTIGINTYAQSVINAVGVIYNITSALSNKMDLVDVNPIPEQIDKMPNGQFYSDTTNKMGIIKGVQNFYDTNYINSSLLNVRRIYTPDLVLPYRTSSDDLGTYLEVRVSYSSSSSSHLKEMETGDFIRNNNGDLWIVAWRSTNFAPNYSVDYGIKLIARAGSEYYTKSEIDSMIGSIESRLTALENN